MKILLVEDSDFKAGHILEECLGHEVTRVITLVDGMQELELHQNDTVKYDAVISDWMFPYREGGEIRDNAGDYIVEEAQSLKIPVIVCSNREVIPPKHKAHWLKGDETSLLKPWLEKLANPPTKK